MKVEDFDPLQWDRWIGHSKQGPIVMLIKHLFAGQGCYVDLHRMVYPDMPNCYHTHPATAIRIVQEGGYIEELFFRDKPPVFVERKPGYIGVIHPYTCHRVHGLLNGEFSTSLWLRGPVTHPIWLRGHGWPPELRDTKVSSGNDDKHRSSALSSPDPNPWRAAIIDALVVNFILSKDHETDPRRALHDLIVHEQEIALDPTVSERAQALIEQGRREGYSSSSSQSRKDH